jgi:hypothetical protein
MAEMKRVAKRRAFHPVRWHAQADEAKHELNEKGEAARATKPEERDFLEIRPPDAHEE